MKSFLKIQFVFILVAWSVLAVAQNFETVNTKELNGTADKSYIVNQYGIIKAPFSHNAATQGPFFLRANTSGENDPSKDKNFVRTEVALVPVGSESGLNALPYTQKSTNYEYSDGLGRTIQQNALRQSTGGNDLISYTVYDELGRVPEMRLPYAAGQSGAFRGGNLNSEQSSFYSTGGTLAADAKPYGYVSFEASPLNRVTQSYGPGSDWHSTASNKPVSSITRSNTTGEVKKWTFNGSALPSTSANHAAGELSVQEVTNERGQIQQTFTNFLGQVILNRVGDGTNWNETYYIYNYAGQTCFVFPPEASNRIASEYSVANATDKQLFLDRWCFQYKYDNSLRLSDKRVPGADWVYFIYDKWDRVVFVQDGNQRLSNQWLFTKYDIFNRPIITGLTTGSRTSLESNAGSASQRFESRASNPVGYTNNTIPSASLSDMLTISYYDDYAFIGYSSWASAGKSYSFVNETGGFPQTSDALTSAKGKTTGSKIKVLETSTSTWLNSVVYYDNKYRAIQSISDNYLSGQDRLTSNYDFVGKVLQTKEVHAGAASVSILKEYSYDHGGRLLRTYQTIDNGTRTLLADNKYNELGQLIEKNVHSTDNGATYLQSIDYRYNIRGWLSSINNNALTNDGSLNNDNNDLFGMELKYNQSSTIGSTTFPAVHDGNISSITWNTNNLVDAPQRKMYGYQYDVFNRLLGATYARNNNGAYNGDVNAFDEALSYDKNGNIKTLSRKTILGGNIATVDQLNYKYGTNSPNFDNKGNQLTYIDDGSSYDAASAGNADWGFVENTKQVNMGATTEYDFDANGNLKVDYNKGITGSGGITYNHLNLPVMIPLQGGGTLTYTYDAAGNKLRKVASLGGTTMQTDYAGNVHYQGEQLAFILNSEGRAVKNGSSYNYEYFHRDHLGNTRVVYGYQKETYHFRASMEPERSARETQDFKNIVATSGQNKTAKNWETPNPGYSAALNGNVGPSKLITVVNNDKVTIDAYAFFNQTVSGATVASTVLAASVGAGFGLATSEAAYSAITNSNNLPLSLSGLSPQSGAPKAFIGYCMFSPDYAWSQIGFATIPQAASAGFTKVSLPLTITLPGNVSQASMYIFVANQTTGTTVYFDEVSILHEKNTNALQVVQANDYYPFGLAIAPLSYQKQVADLGTSKNKYKFQGQERQDELSLGWDQYKFRMHDPAIGRFAAVDPLAEKFDYNSPYAFSENKVVSHVELEGLEAVPMPMPGPMPIVPIIPILPGGGQQNGVPGLITYSDWWKLKEKPQGGFDFVHQLQYQFDFYYYGFDEIAPYRALVQRIESEGLSPEVIEQIERTVRPEDDGRLYSNYITQRDFKMNSWFFDVTQPLVYTGISTFIDGRYTSQSIENAYKEIISSDVTKGIARGVEQLIVELNNGGQPFPYNSLTIDNFYNSTSPLRLEYYTRKLEGYVWLYTNIPNWQTQFYRPPEFILKQNFGFKFSK